MESSQVPQHARSRMLMNKTRAPHVSKLIAALVMTCPASLCWKNLLRAGQEDKWAEQLLACWCVESALTKSITFHFLFIIRLAEVETLVILSPDLFWDLSINATRKKKGSSNELNSFQRIGGQMLVNAQIIVMKLHDTSTSVTLFTQNSTGQ